MFPALEMLTLIFTYTMETILIRKQTYQLLLKNVDGRSNKTKLQIFTGNHNFSTQVH